MPVDLVEFDPVRFGQVEISRLPLSGALAAGAFLAGLFVAHRLVRRAGLDGMTVLELFAAGAPVTLIASRMPALGSRFPGFLHDTAALAGAAAAPGSILLGTTAAVSLALAFAWASRQPARFLDALGPAGVLLAGAVSAGRATTAGGLLASIGAAAAVAALALLLAWRAARPGLPACASAVAAGVLLGLSSQGA